MTDVNRNHIILGTIVAIIVVVIALVASALKKINSDEGTSCISIL